MSVKSRVAKLLAAVTEFREWYESDEDITVAFNIELLHELEDELDEVLHGEDEEG